MAKHGDTTGKRLGSDAGRQRIAERRARLAGVVETKAGDEMEPGTSAQGSADLAPPAPETSATSKKPAARKRAR